MEFDAISGVFFLGEMAISEELNIKGNNGLWQYHPRLVRWTFLSCLSKFLPKTSAHTIQQKQQQGTATEVPFSISFW